ncbi:unnamed protein product [Adineta ricciae]|uniref:mRNA-capping enzyme n=1 Tax=Adineta ricciae TaxID=249248 RepID=A0A813PDS6_ADIRI|nr:unnamed protein product [Adineta ricciae]
MAASIAFSSIVDPLTPLYDPEGIPAKWIDCPRKSAVIAETFLAFKTPLDDRYKNDIQKGKYWTCKMLIQNANDKNKKLGLVIDLTNTNRYYNSEVEFKPHDIQYKKIRCQGIDNAIGLFAKARQPGIYKQDYLDRLVHLFGDGNTLNVFAPLSPLWHQTASTTPSEGNKRAHDGDDSAQSNKRFQTNYDSKSLPKFAVDIPNVIPVGDKYLLDSIRSSCQSICGWQRRSFPGSQPVSLHRENYPLIFLSPYMVSWKADGTRYMMWIEDKDKVYMLDRNNNAFEILHMSFPRTSDGEQPLTNTLLDGEFVTDYVNNEKIYRYLVYDIIMINNINVSQRSFKERLKLISRDVVGVRDTAHENGRLDKQQQQPFSIKAKSFWTLEHVTTLLSEKFQSKITHGCDGLVFQPVDDPYQCGRSDRVLKWKGDNTIDFQLKIIEEQFTKRRCANLYVNYGVTPFATMSYSTELEQYNNQIIECSFREQQWHFYRHRTDKKYANAQATADGVMNALTNAITKDYLLFLIDDQAAANEYFSNAN